MNAVSLNNLWSYLQGLSLSASNQRWLGERLIEASVAKKHAAERDAVLGRRSRGHSKKLSDEELSERLSRYAPLTDADFPDLSPADYANHVRQHSGQIAKGLEKWL